MASLAGLKLIRMCRFGSSGHRVGRRGEARRGAAWLGLVRQARLGSARPGLAGRGMAEHGRLGMSRRGPAWTGFLLITKVSKVKIESIKWKQNVPTKGIDATKAHKALEAIRTKNNGLTDDNVLAAACNKGHVLNKWFEWDDSVAAAVHRRDQARLLIRSLEVTYIDAPGIKTRVYEVEHKSRPQDPQRTVYTTTEEVLANPESRDRLIAEAIKAAMQFRRRFKMLHELDGLMIEIDKVVEKMGAGVLV